MIVNGVSHLYPLSATNSTTQPSSPVIWSTPSGSLGSFVVNQPLKTQPLNSFATDFGQITYSLASGKLPNGLSLDPVTGVISGTPTSAQNASFTIEASDSNGGGASRAFSLAITAGQTTSASTSTGTSISPVSPSTLVAAQSAHAITPAFPKAVNLVIHDTVSLQLNASSTAGAVTYAAQNLPAGLSLSSTGLLQGTVMAQSNQTLPVTVILKDKAGNSTATSLTINILPHHYPGWNNVAKVTVSNSTVP